MAGNVAYQVGPPATQMEVVPLITPAVKASTQQLASAVAATTALAAVPLAVGSAAAITMQRIEEEVGLADEEAQALSDATWEHDVDGEDLDDAASGQTAVDGPGNEADGDDAAASEPELAADAATGGGRGAGKHDAPAARPRQRKRVNPQRARLHSQALVMSPVQKVTAAELIEAPLPLVTVGIGPIPKRRRTGSSRQPRNTLQARLEAAVGDTDGKQVGAMCPAAAGGEGQPTDCQTNAEPQGRQRKHSTASAGQDGEVSADAADPPDDQQPASTRSQKTDSGTKGKTGQRGADRPRRRGSELVEAEPTAAGQPEPQAQDAGRLKTGKRKTRSDEVAEAVSKGKSRRAATAAKATVANSPSRRRTVAVLDPRLGGTAVKSAAGKGSAARRSAAKGTSKPGHHPCFALRGLHTKVATVHRLPVIDTSKLV